MRSVFISPLTIGRRPRFIGAHTSGIEGRKTLTNRGGLSGPPFWVHYIYRSDNRSQELGTAGVIPGEFLLEFVISSSLIWNLIQCCLVPWFTRRVKLAKGYRIASEE